MTATFAPSLVSRRALVAIGCAVIQSFLPLAPRQALAGRVVVDSAGFDAPTFALGNVVDQNGWKKRTIGTGLGTAMVQSSIALGGGQSLQVNRAANSYDRWAVPHLTNVPTGRFVLIDWSMLVLQTTAPNGAFGPFMGMDAYGSNTNPFSVLASLGVDAATGEVIYQASDGSYVTPGPTVAFGQWHRFQVLLDYQAHAFRSFVNGVLIASDEFVDQNLVVGGINTLDNVDILAGAAAGDSTSLALTGTAYFDNFLVTDGIPGDFDSDGDVDAADLAQLVGDYGLNGDSDGDGDLDSDGAEMLIWQRHLGVNFFPATVVAGAAVPEPAAAALAMLGLFGLAARRRR